jgi:hypothetical protein
MLTYDLLETLPVLHCTAVEVLWIKFWRLCQREACNQNPWVSAYVEEVRSNYPRRRCLCSVASTASIRVWSEI